MYCRCQKLGDSNIVASFQGSPTFCSTFLASIVTLEDSIFSDSVQGPKDSGVAQSQQVVGAAGKA